MSKNLSLQSMKYMKQSFVKLMALQVQGLNLLLIGSARKFFYPFPHAPLFEVDN